MSMPKPPNPQDLPTKEQALSAIIASVAMEEEALARLITAESEKITHVLELMKAKGLDPKDLAHLLAINTSIAQVMNTIKELQLMLIKKLAIATEHLGPPKPEPCTAVFITQPPYKWQKSRALFLIEKETCPDINLSRQNGECIITLPAGKDIDIALTLNAVNNKRCPILLDIEFYEGNKIVRREGITHKNTDETVEIIRSLTYATSQSKEDKSMVIRLVSPENLSCVTSQIEVTA
ncbi:MAG: hypothetical protein FWE11_07260 [Defluviitaleaceae bacterium]|nr:hypothetical protein [Defluviitaleaceae bacterium]